LPPILRLAKLGVVSGKLERGELGAAKAAAVKQRHEGSVARGDGRSLLGADREEGAHLARAEGAAGKAGLGDGQAADVARAAVVVVRDEAQAPGLAQHAPQGRQKAIGRGWGGGARQVRTQRLRVLRRD
jgi:hypothetical protein